MGWSRATSTRPAIQSARSAILKRWAVDAGFDRAGIATLEPSENGAVLRRWLARGEHAGMEWIGRRIAVREDPARLCRERARCCA